MKEETDAMKKNSTGRSLELQGRNYQSLGYVGPEEDYSFVSSGTISFPFLH